MMVEMHEQEQRQLTEDRSNPNDNSDHHSCPRKDFPCGPAGAKSMPQGTQPNEACDIGLIS